MAAVSKKRPKKRNQSITLNEFRAWLSGVHEMQPDDWVPSKTQWKTVLDKIDCIVESAPVPQPESSPSPLPQKQQEPNHNYPSQEPVYYPASDPSEGSGLDRVPATSANRQLIVGASRVPDVDSSNGQYTSPYDG